MKTFFVISTIVFCLFQNYGNASDLPKTYRLVDIGTLASDESSACAINDNNQIVGSYKLQGKNYVFLWDEKQGITILDIPSNAVPKVINDQCQIAGEYTINGSVHGFFWDQNLGFIDIQTLGGKNSYVTGMNNTGQVIGYSETNKTSSVSGKSEVHAFVWQNKQMNDLSVLRGDMGLNGDESLALSINDLGEIVGYSNYPFVHKGKQIMSARKAVIWIENSIQELLPELGKSCWSEAVSITNESSIAIDVTEQDRNYLIINNIRANNKSTFSNRHLGNRIKSIDNHTFCGKNIRMIQFILLKQSGITGRAFIITNLGDFWKNISLMHDVNTNFHFVGIAETLHGEKHAILAIPEN